MTTSNPLPMLDQISQKLVENGHREHLLALLIDRLHTSGWYEQTRQLAANHVRDQVNSHNPSLASSMTTSSSVSSSSTTTTTNGVTKDGPTEFQTTYEKVQMESWPVIPSDVKKEIYAEILKSLKTALATK